MTFSNSLSMSDAELLERDERTDGLVDDDRLALAQLEHALVHGLLPGLAAFDAAEAIREVAVLEQRLRLGDVLGRAGDDDALDVAELLDLLEHVDDDGLTGEDEELLGNRLVHPLADTPGKNDHSGLHWLHLATLGSDARHPETVGWLDGGQYSPKVRAMSELQRCSDARMAPVFHIGNVMQDNAVAMLAHWRFVARFR